MRPSRRLLAALLALPLAGCSWTTEPSLLSIRVEFTGNHTTNADGTCTVQFTARAAGVGTITWERVAIVQGGAVVEELRGDQTAQFWGESQLEAGEQQLSAPFDAPDRAADTRIDITFRAGDRDSRESTLRPVCPEGD